MIVLKIIGWILLGILALIILALCVKVRFRIEYSAENTSVLLKWLFLKIKLYPMKNTGKKKKEKTPVPQEEDNTQTENTEETEEPKQKGGNNLLKTLYDAEGIDGLISILQSVLGYTKTFFGNMIHGFVIDELYLDVRCTRSDAAETAIYYGEVCAVLFPLLGALAAKCRMKKYDFNIYPDFIARFSEASFVTAFHFTPMYLMGITLAYVFKLLFGVVLKLIVKISGVKKSEGNRNNNKKSEEKSEEK